jgi:HEAT repeat protein
VILKKRPSFSDLCAASGDQSIEVRGHAAAALGELGKAGDLRVIPLLLGLLADAGPYIGEAASDALVGIREPTVRPLVELLKDRSANPLARSRAVRTLATLRTSEAYEALVGSLTDKGEDMEVRRMAAFYLGRLGDRRALEPLTAAMSDTSEDVDVRRNAAHALGDLGDERAFESLLARLQDSVVGNAAGSALEELRDKRAIVALLPSFASDDETWRYRVAPIVGKGGPKALEPLLAGLGSRDWRVRATAARALSYTEADRAVVPLIGALEHDLNAKVRGEAAAALSFFDGKQVEEALLRALQDPDSAVRQAGAQGLYQLTAQGRASPHMLPALEAAASSDDLETEARSSEQRILLKAVDRLRGRPPRTDSERS